MGVSQGGHYTLSQHFNYYDTTLLQYNGGNTESQTGTWSAEVMVGFARVGPALQHNTQY